MRALCIVTVAAVIWLTLATGTRAAISGLTRVASGLSSPIFVTHAPDDRSRLFIAERGSPGGSSNASASIRILDLNTGLLNPTPFLTITGVDNSGEGGLLGMAFHPNYQTNGKFYVQLTAGDTNPSTYFTSYVREYTVSANPNVANSAFTPILNFGQPQANHNGGWIGFSPLNGYLYIPTGDGGGSNDDGAGHTAGTGNAQDITDNLLGKILRIDVNSDDFPADANRNYHIPPDNPYAGATTGDDEIWAIGMRNPFRDSFDRITGDLWLGDVGQSAREEIDRQPANAAGAENFGWRLREGNIQTPTVGGAIPPNYRAPVYDYAHVNGSFGGTVVTGGYVYRGPDPSLQGKYFFLDSRNSAGTTDDNYWNFDIANPAGTVANINSLLTANTGTHQFPVSFGEDAVGNLYIAYLVSGEVYRISTNQLLPGDYDADGDVDNDDAVLWRVYFGTTSGSRPADGNGNGAVDAADYVVWRNNLGASVHMSAAARAVVPEPAVATQLLLWTVGQLLLRPARRCPA